MTTTSSQGNEPNIPLLYILSDGTGDSARKIIKSASTQFKTQLSIEIWSGIQSSDQIIDIINRAKEKSAIIFHTLTKEEWRNIIETENSAKNIIAIDLLGPTISVLREALCVAPSETSGSSRQFEEDVKVRTRAFEFAEAHDDGKDPDGLKNADIILVGVSRSLKTSVAYCLASYGIMVANMPVHYGDLAFPQLDDVTHNKVVVLNITEALLESYRKEKAKYFKLPINHSYTDIHEIRREKMHLLRLKYKYHWKEVSISFKAPEEIAKEAAILVLPKRTISWKD
jgi:hypothetical protein